MSNTRKELIFTVILFVIAATFAGLYWREHKLLVAEKAAVEQKTVNAPVQKFTQNFIAKVLKAPGEVDFETRLKLENDVRELNDKDILGAWQKFTAAKSDSEAQVEAKNLLELLAAKI